MPDEARLNKKTSLALAIARGQSIAAWANQNEVPRRTAFRWASDANVRREAEAWRRRVLSRAIGQMASLSLKAVAGIAKLGASAESESVRLRAWRAILADQMAVAKFSDLEQRMVEVEEQIRERTGYADHSS
jgi:hypothetical protein